jgi:2-(1,2-epoxy-1,2-dihydrophenyl)acetyl-CoA isomerase
MRAEFERAHVTAHDTVAVLTMNHPEALNASSSKMIRGLSAALDAIEKPDSGYRAVILTGEGRGFCSGANLAEPPEPGAPLPNVSHALDHVFHPFLRRLRDLRLPLVTAVNGVAAGIGMSMALMGDVIIAARSAYFLQAFARIGLIPDGGSTWLLPRLVGMARAKELSLLAEKLPAETALEWGLVNRVCDDAAIIDEALALARKLAGGPTAALVATRKLYFESLDNSYEEQLSAEREAQERASRTQDFREGIAAFLQKQPAKFLGR